MKKLLKILGNRGKTFKLAPISYLLLAGLTGYVIWQIATDFRILSSAHAEIIGGLIFAFLFSCYGLVFQVNRSKKTDKHRWINLGFQLLSLLFGYGMYRRFSFISSVGDEIGSGFYQIQIMAAWGLIILGIFLLIGLLRRKREKGTWISWNTFLNSVYLGVLAALVLWLGVAGIVYSVDVLFFDNIFRNNIYGYLAAVCFIFINGTFILNYYNYSLEELIPKDEKSDFSFLDSKVRRVFGRYIFLPLTIAYFLILFAYVLKILITGIWPKGIVVFMGSRYFAFAMLNYYLIYPEESVFFTKLKNGILVSFLFVGGLMSYAIGLRINQYGLTMRRCIILLATLCVLLYPLLGLIFRNQRLGLLTYTVVGVFGIGIFGPINIDHLALSSQINTIKNLLSEQKIALPLGSGALSSLTGDNSSLIKKLDYMAYTYPLEGLDQILESKNICAQDSRWACASTVFEYLGINTDSDDISWIKAETESTEHFRFNADDSLFATGLDIKEYSKIYNITTYDTDTRGDEKGTGINPNEIEQKYVDDLAKISKEKREYYEDYAPYEVMIGEKKFIITGAHGERSSTPKVNGEQEFSQRKLTRARGYLLVK